MGLQSCASLNQDGRAFLLSHQSLKTVCTRKWPDLGEAALCCQGNLLKGLAVEDYLLAALPAAGRKSFTEGRTTMTTSKPLLLPPLTYISPEIF